MTPVESVGTVPDLLDELATFRYSLFRLETLQYYSGSSVDSAYAAWQRDGSLPLTQELADWCDRTARRVEAGATVQRVHVVPEPLTDYLRFELASYAPNVEAGEDVRIIPTRTGWPVDVPRDADFWLVDSRTLWIPRYGDGGKWLGAMAVTDPARVVSACFARDAALSHGISWRCYTASRAI